MGLPQPTSMTKDQMEAKMVEHEGQLTRDLLELAKDVARREGISLAGITILGGKIYVNVTGLDTKIKNIEKDKNWVKAGVESECLMEPKEENDYRGKYRVTITMFDKAGFEASIKLIKPKDKDLVELLKNTYLMPFTMEGSASLKSVKMSTMKNADFIEMMAERRASNRAKREITGCGLTSIEEMDVAPEMVLETPEKQEPGIIPEKEGEPEQSPEQANLFKSGPEGFDSLKAKMVGKIMSINSKELASSILPKSMTGDQANQLMGIVEEVDKDNPITIDEFLAEMRKIGGIE